MDGKSRPPYVVHLLLNQTPLEMEVDTGAAMSLISQETYWQLWEVPPALKPSTIRLHTYSGQQLVVLGTLKVKVKYEAQQVDLSVMVVEGSGPSLLGRDWLEHLKLNWKKLSVHYTPLEWTQKLQIKFKLVRSVN